MLAQVRALDLPIRLETAARAGRFVLCLDVPTRVNRYAKTERADLARLQLRDARERRQDPNNVGEELLDLRFARVHLRRPLEASKDGAAATMKHGADAVTSQRDVLLHAEAELVRRRCHRRDNGPTLSGRAGGRPLLESQGPRRPPGPLQRLVIPRRRSAGVVAVIAH